MPSFFAYAMLVLWPVMGAWIARKKTDASAAVLVLLVPYLLLPAKAEIDFPLIPPIDKYIVASMFALFLFAFKRRTLTLLPKGSYKAIMLLLIVSPLATMLTNRESLSIGVVSLPGLGFSEFINMLFGNVFRVYVPFILGYCYFRDDESHKLFIKYILIAGLVYAVPIMWEVRMSPQLHTQIYGFFPHDFIQMVRGGGFRPVVFLGHGLLVAIFIAMALIASVGNWKQKIFDKGGLFVVALMMLVLILCKSWGALIFGFMGLVATLFIPVGLQKRALLVLAVVVFLYPALRAQDWMPVDKTLEFFSTYSEDRTRSLRIRFDNEDLLLDRAREKGLFGWGIWGRSRLYNPRTGEDAVITDGSWIIVFGTFGWLGYLLVFGLLCLPVFQYAKMKGLSNPKDNYKYLPYIAMMMMINVLDSIPNSSINNITLLMAGILAGSVHEKKIKALKKQPTGLTK